MAVEGSASSELGLGRFLGTRTRVVFPWLPFDPAQGKGPKKTHPGHVPFGPIESRSEAPYVPHEDPADPTAPNAAKQHEVKVSGGGAGFTVSQHAGRVHEGESACSRLVFLVHLDKIGVCLQVILFD